MSAPGRYQVYRISSTKTLLIADSQARILNAGNLNILSMRGACLGTSRIWFPRVF